MSAPPSGTGRRTAEPPALPPRLLVRPVLLLRRLLLRLADALVPPQLPLFERAFGVGLTGLLAVAARHRLADRLADGPRFPDELARDTGLAAEPLARVLRALALAGVFAREGDGRYRNNRLSLALREGVPGSMRALCDYLGSASNVAAWGDFEETVRTGRNAFERVHGRDVWAHFDAHPHERAVFAEAMAGVTALDAPAVAAAYPFGEVRRVCDVGGGRGQLLAALLARHPHLTGVLLDAPGVVAQAPALLAAAGVAARVEVHAGSFFDGVPAGADAYVLRDILHDWDDARCLRILGQVARALPPGGRVLVCETLVEADTALPPGPLVDVQMMTVCCEGRQRSRADLARLFAASGLRLARVVPTPLPLSVVEAVAA